MRNKAKMLVVMALLIVSILAVNVSVMADYETPHYGIVTGSVVNIRALPTTESEILGQLPRNSVVTAWFETDGWICITGGGATGYMFGEYIEVHEGDANEVQNAAGQQIVDYAANFLGTPYVYGGSTPSGFDCSGFTSYVLRQFGINVNRTAAAQASNGYWVDRSNLQPGDLVFFGSPIHHVGIYAGNGTFIHSPRPGKTVCYDTLTSGYYNDKYVTARRVVN